MTIEVTLSPHDADAAATRRIVRLEGNGPFTIGRAPANDVVVPDQAASRLHARIEIEAGNVFIVDADSANGTRLDGVEVSRAEWKPGARVAVAGFILELLPVDVVKPQPGAPRTPLETPFPPPAFDAAVVDPAALRAAGIPVEETDFLALGGGLGSFVWVDHLRIFGVPAERIRAIGVEAEPHAKYERLCRNSQIPRHERLRSNSISTPDNIWGFPGYASRETWRELRQGKSAGLKYIMQVFGEPAIAESYTPRAGDVFASLEA